MSKEKKNRLDDWFSMPREEVAKRTTQFAKGYMAHKTEDWHSNYAHPEHIEAAELHAEQIKDMKDSEDE